MPIVDLQRRARELGRIRLGQVVTGANNQTRPEKLDRFRLTSASEPLIGKVAELYGGVPAAWSPQGGGAQQWEVVTQSTRLPVLVPPQPVSQYYELWSGGGCQRRCDGERGKHTSGGRVTIHLRESTPCEAVAPNGEQCEREAGHEPSHWYTVWEDVVWAEAGERCIGQWPSYPVMWDGATP